MTTDPVLADLYAQIEARKAVLAHAAAVLQAIDAEIGSCTFISAELADLAELQQEGAQRLRASIIAAVGSLNTRKLGWLLADIDGVPLGGLEVHRLGDGSDHRGAVWQVVAAGL